MAATQGWRNRPCIDLKATFIAFPHAQARPLRPNDQRKAFTEMRSRTSGKKTLAGILVVASVALVAAIYPVSGVSAARVSSVQQAIGTGVNLSLSTTTPSIAPAHTGVQTFTILNTGAPTRGPSTIVFVTPFYVNIDRDRPLPNSCKFLLKDPDPTVPEVVSCNVPAGIGTGRRASVDISLAVTNRARLVGALRGMAMVSPATGSPDVEVDLTDNVARPIITLVPPTPSLPAVNIVGLYLTADRPAVFPNQSELTTLVYSNVGPNTMTGRVAVTYITPFYVNFDRAAALPAGCAIRLEDLNPGVPEIMVCNRPKLVVGEVDRLKLSLLAVAGGPRGAQISGALVAPAASTDADFDQSDNITVTGVQVVSLP